MARFVRGMAACAVMAPMLAYGAYPDRPIRIVVPFAAGSLTDIVFRDLAVELNKELKQTIVIENKPGASGIVGTQMAVGAAADGYTLLSVGVTNGASNKSLFRSLPYDPAKDFTSIGKVAESPYLLVVDGRSKVNSLQDLYAIARKEPASVTYGYASGSAQVSGSMLARAGGVKFAEIPYKNSPQILTDIIGNIVQTTLTDFASGMAMVRSGKLKALGVTTKERFPLAPDLPTLSEMGAKDYEIIVWFGLVAPAGLPAPIQKRLSVALNKALASPDLVERFKNQGLTARSSTPEAFAKFIDGEIVTWGKMIDLAGIPPQ
ncbi:ABC transporter substrate-binding protein [Bordetella sp. N]|nr:ABC transporter substrate-binding protein [Bordetella sp. N]